MEGQNQAKENIERAIGFISKDDENGFTLGNYYLLVIGINQYAPHYDNLHNAVGDAVDLVKVLKNNYKFKKTTELYNDKATRHNILKALEDYENIDANDNLLIFFAGHGFAKDPLGYIVPVDAPPDTRAGFIPYSTIIEHFRLIAARHILLVIDCCYAGYLMNYRGKSGKNKTIELEEQLKSRKFLTSGYKEKVPDGPVGGNTPFVKSLLSILKSNDQPKLSITNLFQKIKEELKQIPKINNTPSPMYHELISVGDEGGSMILYLENSDNDELKAYKKAATLRTRQVLEFFINEFKDSPHKSEVESIFQTEYDIQELEWEEARKIKTIESIGSYLNKYPDEFFSTAARRELLKINDLIEKSKVFYQKASSIRDAANKELDDFSRQLNMDYPESIAVKYKESINYLTEAIAIYSDFADAYYLRADLNKFFGNHQKVMEDFSEALRIEYDSSTYSEIAFAKLRMGRDEDALQDFNSIIDKEPKEEFYINRGVVKEKLNDLKGAFQDYSEALKINPNNHFANEMVAMLKNN